MQKIIKTKRIDRFQKEKYEEDVYSSFKFGKALKSYSNDELMFSNYVNTKNNESYKLLEIYVLQSMDDDYSFIKDEFEALDEVKYTYKNAERLLKIINKGYGHKYTINDLKYIFKMKNIRNPKFQFYVFKSKKNLTLILIDFFHLALPSDLYFKNGDVKKMKLDSCYNKVSTYKWDIKNIL